MQKIILMSVITFISFRSFGIPDDGNRGSGTTITTVSTPSGPQSVVTDYNTNDGSTVTTSRDSSGNVTTTTNPGSSSGGFTSSTSDDDDDSSTMNFGGGTGGASTGGGSSGGSASGGGSSGGDSGRSVYSSIVGALSPVSTIFSTVTRMFPNSIGAVSMVTSAVNRTADALQNRFVQELQPHVSALGAGISRMGRDVGSRPIPARGTDEYEEWRADAVAAFYRGVDRSYVEQNLNPGNQLIPNGPMSSIMRSQGLLTYDPRNWSGSSSPSDPITLAENEATNHEYERYRQTFIDIYEDIDRLVRQGDATVGFPGNNEFLTYDANLNAHQRYGLQHSMVIRLTAGQNADRLVSAALGGTVLAARGASVPLNYVNGVAPGGIVMVVAPSPHDGDTYGEQSYEDVMRHELNHAADTAIYNIATVKSQDSTISASDRQYYAEMADHAYYARYGQVAGPESFLEEDIRSQINEVVNRRRNGQYMDYFMSYTEIAAWSSQNPNYNAWVSRVSRPRASEFDTDRMVGVLTANEAREIYDLVQSSPYVQHMRRELEAFVEIENSLESDNE